jgi:hypothetical protein
MRKSIEINECLGHVNRAIVIPLAPLPELKVLDDFHLGAITRILLFSIIKVQELAKFVLR